MDWCNQCNRFCHSLKQTPDDCAICGNRFRGAGHFTERDFKPFSEIAGYQVVQDPPKEKCTICLRHLKREKTIKLECGHPYHKRCIDQWFEVDPQVRCPICGPYF